MSSFIIISTCSTASTKSQLTDYKILHNGIAIENRLFDVTMRIINSLVIIAR